MNPRSGKPRCILVSPAPVRYTALKPRSAMIRAASAFGAPGKIMAFSSRSIVRSVWIWDVVIISLLRFRITRSVADQEIADRRLARDTGRQGFALIDTTPESGQVRSAVLIVSTSPSGRVG